MDNEKLKRMEAACCQRLLSGDARTELSKKLLSGTSQLKAALKDNVDFLVEGGSQCDGEEAVGDSRIPDEEGLTNDEVASSSKIKGEKHQSISWSNYQKPNAVTESMLQTIDSFRSRLLTCKDAVIIELRYQEMLENALSQPGLQKVGKLNTPALFVAEKSLLQLASYKDLADGILYAVPFFMEDNDEFYLYVRVFETGCFQNFFRTVGKDMLLKNVSSEKPIKDVIIVSVFNNWDVEAYRSVHSREENNRHKSQIFSRQLNSTQKNSVNTNIAMAYSLLKEFVPGFLVYSQRKKGTFNQKDAEKSRYYNTKGLGSSEGWLDLITNYICNKEASLTLTVENMSTATINTLPSQFAAISSVPNFHHWTSRSVKSRYWFAHHGGKSPRNIILSQCLDLYKTDQDAIEHVLTYVLSNTYELKELTVEDPPPKKKKRVCSHSVKPNLSSESVLSHLNIDIKAFKELQDQSSTDSVSLYNRFRNEMILSGTMQWRQRNSNGDILIMNDIDSKTGLFKRNDHVVTSCSADCSSFDCSCDMYYTIKAISSSADCVHIRLLKEIKASVGGSEVVSTVTIFEKKVSDALKYVGQPVIQLASGKESVLKFSVLHDGKLEFVHLFQSDIKEWYIGCQSGLCNKSFAKKRKISTLLDCQNLCDHLQVMKENYDMYGDMINMVDEDTVVGIDRNEANLNGGFVDYYHQIQQFEEDEDEEEPENWVDVFDEETGMWLFKSPYGRKVDTDALNIDRIKMVKQRMQQALDLLEDTEEEKAEKIKFYPKIGDKSPCGIAWKIENGSKFTLERKTTLYTKIAPITVLSHFVICTNGCCRTVWNGEDEFIFRSTTKTCAGEEIGWQYVEMVLRTKCTIAAFCELKNFDYAQHGCKMKFMSPKTFKKWFLSWASHQKREFRKKCFGCDSASVVACDGTTIAIERRKTNFPPIEETTNSVVFQTQKRRMDRCFLVSTKKEIRTHLKWLTDRHFGNFENLDHVTEVERTNVLRDSMPSLLRPLFEHFYNRNLDSNQMTGAARFFKFVSTDAPIRSFFPTASLPLMKEIVDIMKSGNPLGPRLHQLIHDSKEYSCFLSDLITPFLLNLPLVKDVLEYIINQLEEVAKCVEPPELDSLINRYNPPRLGRAYYFTKEGHQIRNPRKFTIDEERATDPPMMWQCNKIYPKISSKGSCMLFLFFCPIHGHCYGYHIVNGSEGRKDPCQAMYTHMQEAPKVVFYDNGCQLEEYCLNRESGFYEKTQFYHDVFHGYSHKCPGCYSIHSGNPKIKCNSSICEQFNSFLQNIKGSAKKMNQITYSFYVQFMIDEWNIRKEKSFMEKLKVVDKCII